MLQGAGGCASLLARLPARPPDPRRARSACRSRLQPSYTPTWKPAGESTCWPHSPSPASLLPQIVGAGAPDLPCATVHAPLALLPVAYPQETFQRAKQAAQVFNLMIDRVAQDEAYLQEVLAAAALHDDFTVRRGWGRRAQQQGGPRWWHRSERAGQESSSCGGRCRLEMAVWLATQCEAARPRPGPSVVRRPAKGFLPLLFCLQARLLRVYEQTADVRHTRLGSERVLAVNRSDYMLHEPTSGLLQVCGRRAAGAGRHSGAILQAPWPGTHCINCQVPHPHQHSPSCPLAHAHPSTQSITHSPDNPPSGGAQHHSLFLWLPQHTGGPAAPLPARPGGCGAGTPGAAAAQ